MPIALSSCNCFGKCITSQNDVRFLTDNRSKGHISRKAAKKVGTIYGAFRKKQDAEHISGSDRETAQYPKAVSRIDRSL